MQTDTRIRYLARPPFVAVGLLVLALFQSAEQLARAVIGRNDLWSDAANVWLPLAEHVAGGNALYVGAAVDNKPPLWQYLNLAVFETGHYVVVFYLLVGLANAVAAWLLYRWVSEFARRETGAIAALLFVAALPIVNGTIINVRSFAVVFVLAAVQARRAGIQGALIALGGLLSQYAVFGIPVVLWHRHRVSDLDGRAFVRFTGAGLGTVVLAFLPLLLWGVPSLVGGLEWSFADPRGISSGGVLVSWLTPFDWAAKLGRVGERLFYIFVPAALFVGRRVAGRRLDTAALAVIGYAVLFALPLGIRSLRYYWILTLPFLAALAALEAESVYRTVS